MAKRLAVKAIIFDMDGTLTVPILDFDAMRAEIGIVGRRTILEAIEEMPPEQADHARAVIVRHEAEASRHCRLNPGAGELLAWLAERGVPMALLTRNSRASAEAFCERFGVRFACVHTREDGVTKPSPEPVLHLCRQMGVPPGRTLVVGDYLYDVVSGRSAGAPTCLLVHGEPPEWADQADILIRSLDELPGRIELPDPPPAE
jgi:HAD superfamily hydrolase (TIGR01549 family)